MHGAGQQDGFIVYSGRKILSVYNIVSTLPYAYTYAAKRKGHVMIESEVREASNQFYAALNSMFRGQMALMHEVWSHASDVTNMGPFGGRQVGWEAVRREQPGRVDPHRIDPYRPQAMSERLQRQDRL